MKKANKTGKSEFDIDQIKLYMLLSPQKKLRHTIKLYQFLYRIAPSRTKKLWKWFKQERS